MTKQPKYEINYAKYDHNQANTHGPVNTHASKLYGHEAYADTKGYSSEVYNSRQGYGAPVKGYGHQAHVHTNEVYDNSGYDNSKGYTHGDDYNFSGSSAPTTAGHYVGYGNKYDFRHGYPYGYGEMLDNTPAGYSLHSGSMRLITKPDYNLRYSSGSSAHRSSGSAMDTHSQRKGYAAPEHGNKYKFSGRSTPVTAGHYVGYGNKYDFRHGYPYGYGDMLDNTPYGYALHSGFKYSHKQPSKNSHNHGYTKY